MSIPREKIGAMKFGNIVTGEKLAPAHPGEILLHDFIEPMGVARYKVAKSISVPQRRIDEICAGNRAITADAAMRLGRLFGISAQTWMNLQAGMIWKSPRANSATGSTRRSYRLRYRANQPNCDVHPQLH